MIENNSVAQDQMQRLIDEAARLLKVAPDYIEIIPIKSGASSRSYFRFISPLTAGSVIGVIGSVKAENEAFIHITESLYDSKAPLPTILWHSEDGMSYITSDNGILSLFDVISSSCQDKSLGLCEEALYALSDMQVAASKYVDFKLCYPVESTDKRSILWDLSYFKYCFLKPVIDNLDEPGLQDDFDRLCLELTDRRLLTGFQYHDFQSRNILVDQNNKITFIDYQGARRGMLLYDAASFIWQARAGFNKETRDKLADSYFRALRRYFQELTPEEFKRQLELAITFRQLQTLGTYGFRGLVQKKIKFSSSISKALENIRERISQGAFDDYRAVRAALEEAYAVWNLKSVKHDCGRLTLTVTSFSFHRGYPEDTSGNGGGFVFDCRGMLNPGRYDEFKQLTGLDSPVIKFLEEQGECSDFIRNAVALVSPTIDCYLKRGFTSLCVSFGCTGGQHRSVFCAEGFAHEIRQKYPQVNTIVKHREQPDIS